MFARAGKITDKHEKVGLALLRRLGEDGRCDPSHATLADDVGCDVSTVERALKRMAACGLVSWTRRLVRAGWQAVQTSNAYVLTVERAAIPHDPQVARPTPKTESFLRRLLRKKAEPTGGSDEWGRWNAQRQLDALAAFQHA